MCTNISIRLLYLFLFASISVNLYAQGEDTLKVMTQKNKIFPESIEKEVLKALSFYPEMAETHIEFKFREHQSKSFMQAQPKFWSLFRFKRNRRYVIQISEEFKIKDEVFTVDSVPSDILIGWLGHELGHIFDYLDRSTINLLGFGANYVFFKKSVRTTERSADINAIMHGMGQYIFDTRSFILDRTDLPEKYKLKIQKLYLSPPEILELIEEHDKKEIKEILKSPDPKAEMHHRH